MQFWTSDRCKQLKTEILLDSAKDLVRSCQKTKSLATIDKNLAILKLIQDELLARAAA